MAGPRPAPPVSVPIAELVSIIRSKNAGPFRLTLDLLFKDDATYRRVKASRTITPELVARLYRVTPDQVTNFVEFDPGRAIKITLVRPAGSGAFGDGDVYGAQQHAPLLDIQIPLEEEGQGTEKEPRSR